ncbi:MULTISPECIES: chromate resistance protein ChrB domain-containing protein [unclassified Nocardioides]|uniref:chromate resistance protein ChrB domain-containing protein n=1 Tax=unclassified Nocardioides TaxID=2615069 RepID=UPI0000570B8F|nr:MULTISPECIES: chromate resistance protein ChrB domain-containing protein [unclassified Nocardioides]ABL81047.1 putative chromate resistance protein [Nocardioides sp. JS614]
MRWATRAGVHIDRAACAWLIRRYVDPEAEFAFVTDPDDVPADATPFDMRGVDLGHQGSDCTFETILRRYDLTDPVLWRIAAIVHEADIEDEAYDAPEAPGFDLILRALSISHPDADVLAITKPIFDAVYGYLRRSVIDGNP